MTRDCRWFEEDGDLWKNAPPKVEITYDDDNSWLLEFNLSVDNKTIELEDEDGTVEDWCSQNFLAIMREQGACTILPK